MILSCLAMILMAMELTTKYEEQEETDAIAKNARGEMDVLLQDENVVFETESTGTEDLIPPRSRWSQRKSTTHLYRSGSKILQEFIAHDRSHHHEPA